jgi:hypothetical protein
MTKKSIKRASADVGLIFTAYNLRRIFNLIDKNQLNEYLKGLALLFFMIITHFKSIKRTIDFGIFKDAFSKQQQLACLNGLYLAKKQFEF